mmetsp:Transcript_21803/g.27793  ORF Transcript_21803/g.27793 Transcript_21803/m.27793 type:complete len:535 (-) Transcript_21803:24-1628(-)
MEDSAKKRKSKRLSKKLLLSEQVDITSLLEFYQSSKQPIVNCRAVCGKMQQVVERLFEKDYLCVKVNNEEGSLCPSYPFRICIPVAAIDCPHCASHQDSIPSISALESYFASSSLGRGRGRFVAPVSLLHYHDPNTGTHYARFSLRSASLIQKPEVLLNKVTRRKHRLSKSMEDARALFANVELDDEAAKRSKKKRIAEKLKISSTQVSPAATEDEQTPAEISMPAQEALQDEKISNNVDLKPTRMAKIRKNDLRSLAGMGVSFIGDLMVEEKLKLLRVLQVISSEKADRKSRYTQFSIYSIPYPGYEYFGACTIYAKKLKGSDSTKHHHEFMEQAFDDIKFSWESLCSTQLNVPQVLEKLEDDSIHPQVNRIAWGKHQTWHINEMTQNYVQLLVSSFAAKNDINDQPFVTGGVLVHCIMGWDRTPTFISMLRMSLWADGVVNSSLTAEEMVYLTIAYDWISFGHDLVYRANQGVELMYFCFNFLKRIQSEEFSFQYALGHEELASDLQSERAAKLQELVDIFIPIYRSTFNLL